MQHYKNSIIILCDPVAGHAIHWEVTVLTLAFPSNREPSCIFWLDPGGHECCLLLQGTSGGREGHCPLPGRKTDQWTHHAHLCKCTQSWTDSEESLASAKLNHVDTRGSPGHLAKMWAQIQGCGCGLGCSKGVWLLPVRGPLVEWDTDKLPTQPNLKWASCKHWPNPSPSPSTTAAHSLFMFMSFCCFPQKTLPLLENQIKETHQRITEELQKYGKDIPEEESEKMFSLIEVRTASGAMLGSRTSLSTGIMGITLIRLHFPKADPNSFCPLSTKMGPELEDRGQGVVDHPMHAIGSSSSEFPHWGPPRQWGEFGVVCCPSFFSPVLPPGLRYSKEGLTRSLHAHNCQTTLLCLEYPCWFFFSSWQKIDTFNKDIISRIEGEEFVGPLESRLFTKVRAEFCKWSSVVEKNFQKGESEAPR